MKNILALTGFESQAILAERPSQISLLIHARRHLPQLLELAACLGQNGPLRVLDGGNCFNIYTVAAALYRRTPVETGRHAYVQAVLQRIQAARAFTCFQMVALVRQTLNPVYIHQAPVLVLELLTTFQDENTPLKERRRLLADCLADLNRLAKTAPVLVTVCATRTTPLSSELLNDVMESASEIWTGESLCRGPEELPTACHTGRPQQLTLFGD